MYMIPGGDSKQLVGPDEGRTDPNSQDVGDREAAAGKYDHPLVL